MNFRQQIIELNEQLQKLGLQTRISLTVDIPMTALLVDEPPARPAATIKTVLWALNALHGAPGQPKRDIIRHFLFYRGWIGANEECEAWHLDHVPTSHPDLKQLAGEINQFEQDMRKPKPEPAA